jgi:hypothetical protein
MEMTPTHYAMLSAANALDIRFQAINTRDELDAIVTAINRDHRLMAS